MHRAKQVDFKNHGDGTVAYCYECCGDPRTRSWATVVHPHRFTPDQIKQFLADHQAGRELRHGKMLDAIAHVSSLPVIAVTDAAGNSHHVRVADVRFAADEIVWVRLVCCDEHSGQCFRDARAGSEYNLEISGVHTLALSDIEQRISDAAGRLADSHAVHQWEQQQQAQQVNVTAPPQPVQA